MDHDRPKAHINISQDSGATVQTQYATLPIKIFPIDESKLDHLSLLNTFSTGFLTAGFSFVSFGAGIVVDIFVLGNGTREASSAIWVILTLCGMLALGFLLVGGCMIAAKRNQVDSIKASEIPTHKQIAAELPLGLVSQRETFQQRAVNDLRNRLANGPRDAT